MGNDMELEASMRRMQFENALKWTLHRPTADEADLMFKGWEMARSNGYPSATQQSARADTAGLVEALRFYSNDSMYGRPERTDLKILCDRGETARKALSQHKGGDHE